MCSQPIVGPGRIGIDPGGLERLYGLIDGRTRDGSTLGVGVCLGRRSGIVAPRFFGVMRPESAAPPLDDDSLFLVASLTKPVTVAAAMILVERGAIRLDDRVAEHVPEFARNGKEEVQLRHLMTHTSGLPDMAPNNVNLRSVHAPLDRFIDDINEAPLLFPPGTRVSYQSAGAAMLSEVVRRVAGLPLGAFLRRELFEPLGMADTSLGARPEMLERVASVRLDAEQEKTDWHWNTSYWLQFGAPWGGLITSPADFSLFCRLFLGNGSVDGVRILSPATVAAMTRNQLEGMPLVPEVDRRCQPWGLGWRLAWPGRSANFGDLLGPRAFGHWGATGTLCWIDPDRDAFLVLFTTQPGGDDGRILASISNAAAAVLS